MVAFAEWMASLLTAVEAVRLELLLFAGFWFTIGAIDELAIDFAWLWLRLKGVIRPRKLDHPLATELSAPIALYVPAWR